MFAAAADLPNTLVGFVPIGFEKAHELDLQSPVELIGFQPGDMRFVHGQKNFAKDIELELIRSRVADPHWLRVFVS